MANYVKVGPFVNGGAPAISKAFLDGLENVLVQVSGGSESGRYRVAGGCYVSGSVVSTWVTSLSRTTSPVSVTIDTSDQSPTLLSSPSAVNQNSGGVLIYGTGTGTNQNCFCAGAYTINY